MRGTFPPPSPSRFYLESHLTDAAFFLFINSWNEIDLVSFPDTTYY
jgi:hypothetical protein